MDNPLENYIVGKYFFVDGGEFYCLRESCEGCEYIDSCEWAEENIQVDIQPHPRRGIGLEEENFLILDFREGVGFKNIPEELLRGIPYPEECMNPSNLHFVLNDLKFVLWVMKGQIRYCGEKKEFLESEYSKFFVIIDEYIPGHKILAMDYSAIEPRITTIASGEKKYIEVFQGKEKIIAKLLERGLDEEYVKEIKGKFYCFLEGELDSVNFVEQCEKCSSADKCEVVKEIFKNISEDWHGLNAEGFYGEAFKKEEDKYKRKEMRDSSKRCGLALCYGGSDYAISNHMGCSREEAQQKIDNFFRLLSDLNLYMLFIKNNVVNTGKVVNLFGRVRDVSKWSHSKSEDYKQRYRDKGYAERTALNHPIQSTSAEILKIATIRVRDLIIKNNWNFLYGMGIPLKLDLDKVSYRDILVNLFSSVHDELVYLIDENKFEERVAEIYGVMQIKDVINAFNVGFDLELDCEYDKYRSWTSTKVVMGSEIYVRNLVESCGDGEIEVNCVLVNFESLDKNIVEKLKSGDEGDFYLAVQVDQKIYFHERKFDLNYLKNLGLEYKLSFRGLR